MRFLQRGVRLRLGQRRKKWRRLGAALGPRQGLVRPLAKVPVDQRQIEQPLAGVVDDVEMHRPLAAEAAQHPAGLDPQRQAQLADGAGPLGPARGGPGHRGKVRLVVEARHRVVGLRLQVGGADRPSRRRGEARHPAPLDHVGDERGDEHRLARPAEAGDAEADDGLQERLGHGAADALDPPRQPVRDIADDQERASVIGGGE